MLTSLLIFAAFCAAVWIVSHYETKLTQQRFETWCELKARRDAIKRRASTTTEG